MSLDGLTYCFGNLYELLFYWGVVTFRLRDIQQGVSKSSFRRLILAWCIRCLVISGFLSGVLIKRFDTTMSFAMFNQLTPVVKVIFSMEYLSCTTTYIENCLSMDYRHHAHINFIHKLRGLDILISQEFHRVEWNYTRTQLKYWYGTAFVGICYFTLSISLIFNLTRCTCGVLSTILIATCYSLITSSLGLIGFIYIAIMDFFRLRFRLMQKLLKKLYQRQIYHEETLDTYSNILKLIEFTKRLSDLVAEFNTVFSFVTAAGVFYDFILMICFVYVVCQKIIASQFWDSEYVFMIFHLSLHSYKVIITCSYGYLLQMEKNNCMHLLGQYDSHSVQSSLALSRTEVYQHWRLHNTHIMAIVGSSLLCNLSMIYIIYNGLANYVIILVQLLFEQLQIRDGDKAVNEWK